MFFTAVAFFGLPRSCSVAGSYRTPVWALSAVLETERLQTVSDDATSIFGD